MRKILIVEDEEILRTTYQTILSTEPFLVHAAPNGVEGLELCSITKYDLILLDLMMPQMNGVEFIHAFQQRACAPAKIIVLSNLSSGDLLEEALANGATKNYIKSDLTPRQLIAAVRYELSQTQIGAPLQSA